MNGLVRSRFEIGETAATVVCESKLIPVAVEAIARAREDISHQIAEDPFFLTTFEPYDRRRATSELTGRMCEASAAADVGPMATVAGAIAQAALEAMVERGCRHGWVDNGGDIALILERPATVEVFWNPESEDALGFELEATDRIEGICSSSGKLGHSVSLGCADVSVAVADSAILADAFATSIGNRIRTREDLSTCLGGCEEVDGFIGGLAILDGDIAISGRIPKIVETEHSPERITVHSRMQSASSSWSRQRPRDFGQGARP